MKITSKYDLLRTHNNQTLEQENNSSHLNSDHWSVDKTISKQIKLAMLSEQTPRYKSH